jgi:predicted nucleic acid-binding protein
LGSKIMKAGVFDTQVVSYAFKKMQNIEIQNALISSITANEFFLTHSQSNHKAHFYIPLPSKLIFDFEVQPNSFPRIEHPFNKHTTDQIILDFQQEHPPIILFNNFSISEVINRRLVGLFHETVSFLEKKQQKVLRKRFSFLIEQGVKCIPVTRKILPIGLDLLSDFTKKYNPKDNFRNTLNDVLILATALDAEATLITQDNLLNRFAVDYFGVEASVEAKLLKINFPPSTSKKKQINRGSKGYVNRGWSYQVRNQRAQRQ